MASISENFVQLFASLNTKIIKPEVDPPVYPGFLMGTWWSVPAPISQMAPGYQLELAVGTWSRWCITIKRLLKGLECMSTQALSKELD